MESLPFSAARNSPVTMLQIPIKVSGLGLLVHNTNGLHRCGKRLLPAYGDGEEARKL